MKLKEKRDDDIYRMLSQLFHNSMVLLATGPRGSYRMARSSPMRRDYYHKLNVAYKLARIAGIIKHRYIVAGEQSVNFVVGENLVKLKKVVRILEGLQREGWITKIWAGKIFYSKLHPSLDRAVLKKDVLQLIFDRLKGIKGFGQIDEEKAYQNLQNKTVWEMLVEDRKGGFFSGVGHFMGTWGIYDLLLSRMAIELSAERILHEHKKFDTERVSTTYPEIIPDPLWAAAKKEAQEKDIEEIKFALQADNLEEIPKISISGYQTEVEHTFIISDVHLREYHHENTEELLRFIWMVKRLNGRLIINGDFFDIWRAGGLDKSWANNTRVINGLTKLREVIFVAGNHDEFLSKLAYRGGILANPKFKVLETYVSKDDQVIVMHGHQLDKFCRPGSWIGRWVTRAVTKMELSRFRKFLEFLNRITNGAFSTLYKFFSIIFGPGLSARLELIMHLFLPANYVINRRVKNIMEWLREEVKLAETFYGMKPSEEKPLVFIIGHLHYEGISFLTEKLRFALQEEYGKKVRLIITDSWTGAGEFVGDYMVLLEKKIGDASRVFVRKEIWRRTEKESASS